MRDGGMLRLASKASGRRGDTADTCQRLGAVATIKWPQVLFALSVKLALGWTPIADGKCTPNERDAALSSQAKLRYPSFAISRTGDRSPNASPRLRSCRCRSRPTPGSNPFDLRVALGAEPLALPAVILLKHCALFRIEGARER